MRRRHAIAVLPVLCALAACGQTGPAAPPPRDPVVVGVLGGPLMTDPDLVGLNQPGAVFTMANPGSAPLPPIDRSDEEIAAIRAEAAALTGAAAPIPAPAEARDDAAPGVTLGDTAARLLGQFGGARGCVGRLGYSATWSARLPGAVPIYPRGHVLDAAGVDSADCRLRAVTFLSPVAPADLVAFYWARAARAGFAPVHAQTGDWARVVAGRGAAGFAAFVRSRDGGAEVMLVTTGFADGPET